MRVFILLLMFMLCTSTPVRGAQVLCDPYITPSSYVTYGDRYVRELNFELAMYSYTCAVQGDENNIQARKGLVMLYIKRGDVEMALLELRQIGE